MHTFAQSCGQEVRQTNVANPLLPVRAHSAQTAAVKSEFVKEHNPGATEAARPGHDFGRMRVYPSEHAGATAHTIGAGNGTDGTTTAPAPETTTPPASDPASAPAGEAPAATPETNGGTPPATPPATPAAASSLRWEHVKRHQWDALWFFCGEHPSGFSTTATLRAQGFTNPNAVEWFVRQGADKVYAPGGFYGPEITLHSSEGSQRADDVHIEVQERMADGTVNNYLGRFTVRKPHHLRQEWTSDHNSCPPGSVGGAGCPGLWTEISYRVFDNVNGTIVGATVNERFPGPVTNDQPNNWSGAAVTSGSSWPNTNGTFVDNLFKCCGTPAPIQNAANPNWGDKVFHMPHEFFVGSTTSGRGCRVQTHTLQFYRGTADHENITSPAP